MGMMRNDGGMTLVEVVIVMAISALMLVMVLGNGAFRQRVSFSGSIDTLTSQIKGIQNEAADAVTLRSCARGNNCANSNLVAFGKLMEFTPNSGTVHVWTLLGDDAMDQVLGKCAADTITLTDGSKYVGQQQALVSVFTRDANRLYAAPLKYVTTPETIISDCANVPLGYGGGSGRLQPGASMALGNWASTLFRHLSGSALAAAANCAGASCNVMDPSNYVPGSIYTQSASLSFDSADGSLHATLVADPATGSIQRRFDN